MNQGFVSKAWGHAYPGGIEKPIENRIDAASENRCSHDP